VFFASLVEGEDEGQQLNSSNKDPFYYPVLWWSGDMDRHHVSCRSGKEWTHRLSRIARIQWGDRLVQMRFVVVHPLAGRGGEGR
jgi:hypothetical protein